MTKRLKRLKKRRPLADFRVKTDGPTVVDALVKVTGCTREEAEAFVRTAAAEDPEVGIDDFGFWPGRRFRLTRQVEVAVEARRNQGGAWELKADDGAFWIMPTGELFFRKEGEDQVAPTGWTVDDLEPTA